MSYTYIDIPGVLKQKPPKPDLLRLLSPIADWLLIGESLDIPYYELKALSHADIFNTKTKLDMVLQRWMNNQGRPVTWETIRNVVTEPPVNNPKLSHEIHQFLLQKYQND